MRSTKYEYCIYGESVMQHLILVDKIPTYEGRIQPTIFINKWFQVQANLFPRKIFIHCSGYLYLMTIYQVIGWTGKVMVRCKHELIGVVSVLVLGMIESRWLNQNPNQSRPKLTKTEQQQYQLWWMTNWLDCKSWFTYSHYKFNHLISRVI